MKFKCQSQGHACNNVGHTDLIINSSAQLSKLNPQTTLRHRILEYCLVNQLKSINDDRDQKKTEKCINGTNYVIFSLRIYIYIHSNA